MYIPKFSFENVNWLKNTLTTTTPTTTTTTTTEIIPPRPTTTTTTTPTTTTTTTPTTTTTTTTPIRLSTSSDTSFGYSSTSSEGYSSTSSEGYSSMSSLSSISTMGYSSESSSDSTMAYACPECLIDYTCSLLPKMTSNTSPSPYEVSCSDPEVGGDAFLLFNRNRIDDNVSIKQGFSVTIFLGYANPSVVDGYAITCGDNLYYETSAPKKWKFYGGYEVTSSSSHTSDGGGMNWVLIDSVDNCMNWGSGDTRCFLDLNNTTGYCYYKFEFEESNGFYFIRLNEITLRGYEAESYSSEGYSSYSSEGYSSYSSMGLSSGGSHSSMGLSSVDDPSSPSSYTVTTTTEPLSESSPSSYTFTTTSDLPSESSPSSYTVTTTTDNSSPSSFTFTTTSDLPSESSPSSYTVTTTSDLPSESSPSSYTFTTTSEPPPDSSSPSSFTFTTTSEPPPSESSPSSYHLPSESSPSSCKISSSSSSEGIPRDGMKLWLDADDVSTIILNGSNVSDWIDKSGYCYGVLEVDGSKQPLYQTSIINGRNAVKFDGLNDSLEINLSSYSLNWQDAMTVFMVYQTLKATTVPDYNSWFSNIRVVTSFDDSFQIDYISDKLKLHYWDSISVEGTVDIETTANQNVNISTIVADGNQNIKTYLNNSLISDVTTDNVFTPKFRRYSIAQNRDNSQYIIGYFAEIIIYSRVLNSTEKQYVENYLAEKWLGEDYSSYSSSSSYSVSSQSVSSHSSGSSHSSPSSLGDNDPISFSAGGWSETNMNGSYVFATIWDNRSAYSNGTFWIWHSSVGSPHWELSSILGYIGSQYYYTANNGYTWLKGTYGSYPVTGWTTPTY